MAQTLIKFESVCIVFGDNPKTALPLMDSHHRRERIRQDTGQILGVHNCSLNVDEGEIVVLMGLSGSGKSTLLRAVNGLNSVIRGKVQVFDNDRYIEVSNTDTATLRHLRTSTIAMVFQQFGLLPWRTVESNIAFGLEIAGKSIETQKEIVSHQLKMTGLEGWEKRKVHELSGGMQQRVGLARAFATESPILLMDEPFSALDPLIRVHLQDELLKLQTQLKRTILFVSHDLDEAIKIGNRIVIMEDGRIIQIGSPEEIILNPATDYVANFVANINPLKTRRAASIMRAYDGRTEQTDDSVVVTPETTLLEVLRKKQEHGGIVLVVADNKCIGQIDHQDIYKALLD